MEILDSTEPFLHWDRNLSELCEPGEIDSVLRTNVSLPPGMDGEGRGGRSEPGDPEKITLISP